MPEGGNASAGASPHVRVGVTREVILPVKDQNGNAIGTANLRPYVQNPPAGN